MVTLPTPTLPSRVGHGGHTYGRCGFWSGPGSFEGGDALGCVPCSGSRGPRGQALKVIGRGDGDVVLLTEVHGADASHWRQAPTQNDTTQVR